MEMHASMVLSWLRKLGKLVSIPPVWKPRLHRCPARLLVAMHVLGPLLSSIGQGQIVASMLLEALLPNILAKDARTNLLARLPTAASLYQTTLHYDAACVLLRRHHNEACRKVGMSRYGFADSSPQCGRHWFVVKVTLKWPTLPIEPEILISSFLGTESHVASGSGCPVLFLALEQWSDQS